MHSWSYDQSQGRHYSSRHVEKFPYFTKVTNLEALSSSSSLADSPCTMKRGKLKSPLAAYKKRPLGGCTNRKCTNILCESFVINNSPGTDTDSSSDNREIKRQILKKSVFKDHHHYHCSSESISSRHFENQSLSVSKKYGKIKMKNERVYSKY